MLARAMYQEPAASTTKKISDQWRTQVNSILNKKDKKSIQDINKKVTNARKRINNKIKIYKYGKRVQQGS